MLNGKETYSKIAASLPWEIQSALLAIRDAGDDTGAVEEIYFAMPAPVYVATLELCLITEWSEKKRAGMKLTTAGEHLVNYCTC